MIPRRPLPFCEREARPTRPSAQGRATAQGLVGHYVHQGGQVAVLVEINCESDFVARTNDFHTLAKEVAMHIAAANPSCIRREDVPAEDLEREKAIVRAQFEGSNKPPHVLDKIVEGKLKSYYEQVVLLDQPSIRDPKDDHRRNGHRGHRQTGRKTSASPGSHDSRWANQPRSLRPQAVVIYNRHRP